MVLFALNFSFKIILNITFVFSGHFSKCTFSTPIIKHFTDINICDKRGINISGALSVSFVQTGLPN